MRPLRTVLTIVLIAASGFVLGSGIAAIPFAENDPCLGGYETLSTDWAIQLVPYGTRCEYETPSGRIDVQELAPSLSAAVAWWVATALLLALALRFRHRASARGVVLGLGVLGVCGLAGHELSFGGGVGLAVVFGAPLWFGVAWLLRPGVEWQQAAALAVVLPFVTLCVWFTGWQFVTHAGGVGVALLVAAGLAAAVDLAVLRFDRWLRSSPPGPALRTPE